MLNDFIRFAREIGSEALLDDLLKRQKPKKSKKEVSSGEMRYRYVLFWLNGKEESSSGRDSATLPRNTAPNPLSGKERSE